MNGDLGDFQTPPALVSAVLSRLGATGSRWPRVLEPTCGKGNFLAGLLALDPPPREVIGIEAQAGHLADAKAVARGAPEPVRVVLTGANVFDADMTGDALGWHDDSGPILVVGNPPWVTNSALGALGSGNRPVRVNLKSAKGLDAVTGASNFDIAEAIWLKLLTELSGEDTTIALLCKTSVARNVLEYAKKTALPVTAASVVKIDARAWFNASVDACLLCVTLGVHRSAGVPGRIPVFAGLDAVEPVAAMGFARGRLVADLDAYAPFAFADGRCPLEWRQGLKHDAAGVMELTVIGGDSGGLRNKRGEAVDIEHAPAFPLLKGSDLSRPPPAVPTRRVIVTQRFLGDDTARLRDEAPRTWAYLRSHSRAFAARKSSIYRGRPEFAMFGVGPYCFAPYKVAVSGLHKAPVFHAVGPAGGRPVMLDDTGYYLACGSPEQAALAAALLNGPGALGLLRALSFPGAKRPVTKAILSRIDVFALLDRADRPALLSRAGGDVARLSGRPPEWPDRLETLFEAPAGPPPLPLTLINVNA